MDVIRALFKLFFIVFFKKSTSSEYVRDLVLITEELARTNPVAAKEMATSYWNNMRKGLLDNAKEEGIQIESDIMEKIYSDPEFWLIAHTDLNPEESEIMRLMEILHQYKEGNFDFN